MAGKKILSTCTRGFIFTAVTAVILISFLQQKPADVFPYGLHELSILDHTSSSGVRSERNSDNRRTNSASALSTNSDDLVFVPLNPYYPCGAGRNMITRLVCSKTILFDEEHNYIPYLPHATDPSIIEHVCKMLVKRTKWFPESDVPPEAIATASICVQTASNSGLLVKILNTDKSNNIESSIILTESEDDLDVRQFLSQTRTNDKSAPRIVPLKLVDFPFRYRKPYNDWEWEPFRDSNFGNLVWRYASTMMLNPLTVEMLALYEPHDHWNYTSKTKEFKSVDALVIATANTLHITSEPQLETLISGITKRVLSRKGVPAIVLGLGIQMEFEADDDDRSGSNSLSDATSNLQLPFEYQKEFLRVVSSRQDQPAIGVRGDLTKSVCDNSGIKHCVSMGCPSLTISRDRNLGKTLHNRWNAVREKIMTHPNDVKIAIAMPAFNSDPPGKAVFTAMELFATILERFGTKVTIIQQFADDAWRMLNYTLTEWKDMYPNTTIDRDGLYHNREEYYSIETWRSGIQKKYDLCISARIHGTMLFIGSGIPAISIPTDFRIMELLHAMHIPHVIPYDIIQLLHPTTTTNSENDDRVVQILLSLMDTVHYSNFTEFEMNRRTKITQWGSILHSAGLEIDPALMKIVHSPL